MVMLGAIAGEIGKALQKDNERVALRTERAMDYLTKELLDEKKDRKNKLETVEEAIERLQSNGYDNIVSASIARGGVYAVQDAVTRAGEARKLGQNANDWYATTAEFSPDQFADMTTAQLANAIVDPVDLSFDRFEDIEGIDKETYRSYMQEYGLAQPGQVSDTARVTVPDFKFDTENAMTMNIKDAYNAAVTQRFKLEQQIDIAQESDKEADLNKIPSLQANLETLNKRVDDLREYGLRSGIISDPGFSINEAKSLFNYNMAQGLNDASLGDKFGLGFKADVSESGNLIAPYEPAYTEIVQRTKASIAAKFVASAKADQRFGLDAEATLGALGYRIITLTEDMIKNSAGKYKDKDIGREAIFFNGYIKPLPEVA